MAMWNFTFDVDVDEANDDDDVLGYKETESSQARMTSVHNERRRKLVKPKLPLPPPPPLEIFPLLTTGPAENRIDLVFFGDGCTPICLWASAFCYSQGGRYVGGENQVSE
jgi:hypothetical protein